MRGLQRGFGVQDLFAADAAGLGQLLAAVDVALRAGQLGLRAQDVGVAQVDVGGQGIVLDIDGAHLTHRLRQLGLGLLQGHVGVGRIQAHQRLAGGDGFRIVGFDGDDGAGHLGRDLHEVAVHVGIVGAFEVGAEQGPPDAVRDRDKNEGPGGQQQQAFTGGIGGGGSSVHDV
ncbi:hypothetical protein D9M68_609660 [compost metagenome]